MSRRTSKNTAKKHTVFLTNAEAIDAVCRDLRQYPSQPLLLRALTQLVLGDETIVSWQKDGSGLSLMDPACRKPRFLSPDQLAELLCTELTRSPPSIHLLARICGCVFHERTRPLRGEADAGGGILLETGMEHFQCRRCARCCRHLDYHGELSDADYRLWQRLGRADILRYVRVIRKNDDIVAYRIWLDPARGQLMDGCPWLERVPDKNQYRCLIYDVRPGICHQYPGSRKHGRMTGCPGFEK